MLAYCRSGTRSTLLWALAEASAGGNPDALTAEAAQAGYDLAPGPRADRHAGGASGHDRAWAICSAGRIAAGDPGCWPGLPRGWGWAAMCASAARSRPRAGREALCGFDAVDVALDRAGIGALLRDAQGRVMLLRRHGAHFAARLLDQPRGARLDRNFLTIGTGERTSARSRSISATQAQVWAGSLRRSGRLSAMLRLQSGRLRGPGVRPAGAARNGLGPTPRAREAMSRAIR